jgi:hypothetical protein
MAHWPTRCATGWLGSVTTAKAWRRCSPAGIENYEEWLFPGNIDPLILDKLRAATWSG